MITSKTNDLIMLIRSLKYKKYRDEHQLFFAEGEKLVSDALASGLAAEHILITEKFAQKNTVPENAEVISDELMEYISDVRTPQGIVSVFRQHYSTEEELYSCRKLLFLDGIQSSDNSGALIRTAVCAGFDGAAASHGSADFYSPKTIRASAGSVMQTKLFTCPAGIFTSLKEHSFEIIAADAGGSEDYQIPDGHFVLVIGSEGKGLSETVRGLSDRLIGIKIAGSCESLNAAVAGGILMYKLSGLI